MYKIISILLLLCMVSVSTVGCKRSGAIDSETIAIGIQDIPDETIDQSETETPNQTETEALHSQTTQTVDLNWSGYFGDLNGAACVYDPAENQMSIYNRELAETRRSPCSTFKIISSLAALENGVISGEDATRTWSGETYWNEDWNQDIGFEDAFRTSCVWYFREVIDELGEEAMLEELERLSYGNCDISDWEGTLNQNNSIDALRGFWIESSLKISPREQVEVMERIFGRESVYKPDTLERLKEVMAVTSQGDLKYPFYGKTGMGKVDGIVVDAWFTGFADTGSSPVYFCVYLGQTDHSNVSSTRAKEIAVRIVSDLYE